MMERMFIRPEILKALVYGANDGIVTTFAVVAGVAGAKLSAVVVIVLGVANLVADGLSMGLGDYLGAKSEARLKQLRGKRVAKQGIWKTGVATFGAFVVAGSMPLLPYYAGAVGLSLPWSSFSISIGATLGTLFLVGSLRSLVTKDNWFRDGLEMMGVGALAAGVAYGLGALAHTYLIA